MNMPRIGTAIILLAGVIGTMLTGCGNAPEPPVSEALFGQPQADTNVTRVSADTLADIAADAKLIVEMHSSEDVLIFDSSKGALDFWRIDLICPNGQQMPMDLWLDTLAKEHGVDIQAMTAREFSVARSEGVAADSVQRSWEMQPTLRPQIQQTFDCEDPFCSNPHSGEFSCYCP